MKEGANQMTDNRNTKSEGRMGLVEAGRKYWRRLGAVGALAAALVCASSIISAAEPAGATTQEPTAEQYNSFLVNLNTGIANSYGVGQSGVCWLYVGDYYTGYEGPAVGALSISCPTTEVVAVRLWLGFANNPQGSGAVYYANNTLNAAYTNAPSTWYSFVTTPQLCGDGYWRTYAQVSINGGQFTGPSGPSSFYASHVNQTPYDATGCK
jgi:hypothetical protein